MKKSFKLKFDDEKDREEVSIEEKDIQAEPEKPENQPAEKPQTEPPRPQQISSPELRTKQTMDRDTVEVSDEEAFRVGKIVIFSVLGLIVLAAIASSFTKPQKQTTKKEETEPQESTQTVFEQKKAAESQQLIANAQKYTVKTGETLYGIAIKLDIAWQDIAKLNDIEPPYTLRTNQELLIPEGIEVETEN